MVKTTTQPKQDVLVNLQPKTTVKHEVPRMKQELALVPVKRELDDSGAAVVVQLEQPMSRGKLSHRQTKQREYERNRKSSFRTRQLDKSVDSFLTFILRGRQAGEALPRFFAQSEETDGKR